MTVEALRRRRPQALDDLLATYGKQILELAAGDVATVTIDGWTIADTSATCGRITTDASAPSLYEAMSECTVTAVLKDSTVSVSRLPKGGNPWVIELNLTD